MLRLLKVKNFALMEDLTINFEDGLTVVTGETGAGKSMIVEAIVTLCGSRMEDVLIRSSKNFAEVTGIFGIGTALKERLKQSGIEVNTDIIIRRKIFYVYIINIFVGDDDHDSFNPIHTFLLVIKSPPLTYQLASTKVRV